MCHDFTDNYSPHIAIERDYNFYCVGKFLRYKIFKDVAYLSVFVNKFSRIIYCIKVLISSLSG